MLRFELSFKGGLVIGLRLRFEINFHVSKLVEPTFEMLPSIHIVRSVFGVRLNSYYSTADYYFLRKL